MRHVLGDVAEQRAQPLDQRRVAAHHDAERAVHGGLARARDRCVGKGDAAGGKGAVELASEGRRRGAGVDHGPPGGQVRDQPAGAQAHRPHLAARGEGQENQIGRLGQRGDGRRDRRAIGGKPLQRRGVEVAGGDRPVVLAHEIAAHGLAHDARANEADAGAAHGSAPSVAKRAAPIPASRPKTAPETRPVPPG